MKLYQKVRKTTTEVCTILCNNCGKHAEIINGVYFHPFEVSNGYGDTHDFAYHEFDLCDSCYCKMIKRFKIKVTTSFGGF